MKKLLCALLIACGLSACGIGNTNTTYDRYNIGQQGSVSYGTIIAMNVVNIAGTKSVGTLGGAVAGGAAGSMIGGNTAVNIIGGVGGAVIGGIIGGATEKAITSGKAVEFLVQEDRTGNVISVVQTNELGLRPGDNVILVEIDGVTRIRQKMVSYSR